MRRTSSALLALAFVLSAGAAEAQTLKIAFINSQEILLSAPGAEAAQQAFDAEMAGYQSEIQQLETELQNLETSLQQQQLTLSPEARASREQQLQAKFQQYQARTTQLQEVANQRRDALTIREEGAYSVIFDVAAGSIISADEELDLTAEVIARLQAASPDGAGSF